MKQTSDLAKLDKFIKAAHKASQQKTSQRKRVTNRTKANIMRVKHDAKTNKIISGTMRRHHMTIFHHITTCQTCKQVNERVGQIEVWDKSNSTIDSLSSTRLNCIAKGKGMYDFHKDLPQRIKYIHDTSPICISCIPHESNS